MQLEKELSDSKIMIYDNMHFRPIFTMLVNFINQTKLPAVLKRFRRIIIKRNL